MSSIEKAKQFIKENCRELEYLRLCHLDDDQSHAILRELLRYQNPDGGFGKALEADLRTPSSSAVATEFAINVLEEIKEVPKKLIMQIITYLEGSLNDKGYWTISPKDVEDYPRAVWWNKERLEGFGTMNPSATLIGFLYKYKDMTRLDVQAMLAKLIDEVIVLNVEDIEEHTLLCLCRLLEYIGEDYHEAFTNKIDESINYTIERDWTKWENYAPEPIKYIKSKKHRLYEENKEIVDRNIEYLMDSMSVDGTWRTKHEWYQFEDVFNRTAKLDWEGVFTVENYKTMKRFGV